MNRSLIALTLALVSVGASARSLKPVARLEEVAGVTITHTVDQMPTRPYPDHTDRDGNVTNEWTTVTATVMSNGCTAPDSFQVYLRDVNPVEQSLEIMRITPDNCRMLAHPISVDLKMPEGFKPGAVLRIANPVLVLRQVVN